MTQDLPADLALIARKRVYFLHHSVGGNILAGVEQLGAEVGTAPIRMATPEDASPDGPVLVHGSGGRNGEPLSKTEAFAALIRGGRVRPSLAFMKLCYVDFNPRTDVEAIFSAYARTLEALEREHPEIRFAHVTTPLTRRPTDLKSRARRLLGLEVWEDASNAKRAEYNRRLVERFPSDPVFDLAEQRRPGPPRCRRCVRSTPTTADT